MMVVGLWMINTMFSLDMKLSERGINVCREIPQEQGVSEISFQEGHLFLPESPPLLGHNLM
jgi:hypothetical protein